MLNQSTFKIQSISDLITNSSSECYMYLSYDGISTFIDIINTVLKLAGSDKTCDDLFEIREGYEDIVVTAIDPENTQAAEILNKVNSIFYVCD